MEETKQEFYATLYSYNNLFRNFKKEDLYENQHFLNELFINTNIDIKKTSISKDLNVFVGLAYYLIYKDVNMAIKLFKETCYSAVLKYNLESHYFLFYVINRPIHYKEEYEKIMEILYNLIKDKKLKDPHEISLLKNIFEECGNYCYEIGQANWMTHDLWHHNYIARCIIGTSHKYALMGVKLKNFSCYLTLARTERINGNKDLAIYYYLTAYKMEIEKKDKFIVELAQWFESLYGKSYLTEKYYTKAAKRGNLMAITHLVNFYDISEETKIKYYIMAADKGHVDSIKKLIVFYKDKETEKNKYESMLP